MAGSARRPAFRIDAARRRAPTRLQGDSTTAGATTGRRSARSSMSGGNVLGRWSQRLADDADFDVQAYYDRADTHRQPAAAGARPAVRPRSEGALRDRAASLGWSAPATGMRRIVRTPASTSRSCRPSARGPGPAFSCRTRSASAATCN
jgi:hypothetical protein